MPDFITVTGMVLKNAPIGEADNRITLLTLEKGKISAFVRGARKPTGRFAAISNVFTFGKFKLYVKGDSYSVGECNVINYFEDLMKDYEGAYYGIYFCEIADYYCRENNDEALMLKLLYQSLRAILSDSIPNNLVRAIFELKSIMVNGEYPGAPQDMKLGNTTLYTLEYIFNTNVEKLFTFTLEDEALNEVVKVADKYRKRFMERKFKSLEILETLC
ncbi:MAG: DNA repair protein RecO [Lachnospiraceae bacterium]|nr:DNA repair protein RecO [Lachnospiraceae bacterium]MCR5254548.1 DNA repair protein RecO [Acetatifactor sp.]